MDAVLCGLAANEALPPELVDRLIAVADCDVAAYLADRADLSRAQAVALAARCEHAAVQLASEGRLADDDVDAVSRPLVALALLDQGAGRPGWARVLAVDPRVEFRVKLAACCGLPPDVVEILVADPEVQVVAELALWTTAQTAARLAQHPHAVVRRAVAANELASAAVLAALATGEGLPEVRDCLVCDREPPPFVHDPCCPRLDCGLPPGAACDGTHQSAVHEIHQMLLGNPATPVEAVVGFAEHPSMLLRSALAARTDLSAQVYGRLADDPVPGVRAALAGNPAIPNAVMRALAGDSGHDVRRALARNPRVPLDVLTRLAGGSKVGSTLLPRIAAASPQEIRDLAASPDPAVRMLVAARRDLPQKVRDALADDRDAKVVKSIAPHPGLSESHLRAMVERHGVRVIAKVATNPDAPAALLEELTRHEPPVQKAFREIARHRNANTRSLLACLADCQARPTAAGHPALPAPVIVDLLADDDWRVAHAAAANPSLPPTAMTELMRRAAMATRAA